MSMIFTRSFVGVYLYGFRIGEYLVLTGFLICIFSVMLYRLKIFKKYKILLNKYFVTIVVSFFVISFLTDTNFLCTYTYKSSSYIWTIGFLIFGLFLHQFLENLNKEILIFPIFIPLIIYIFNTGNYPNFIIDFLKKILINFNLQKLTYS